MLDPRTQTLEKAERQSENELRKSHFVVGDHILDYGTSQRDANDFR